MLPLQTILYFWLKFFQSYTYNLENGNSTSIMILLLTLIFGEKKSKIFPARCAFGLNTQRQINLSHIAMLWRWVKLFIWTNFVTPVLHTSGIGDEGVCKNLHCLQQQLDNNISTWQDKQINVWSLKNILMFEIMIF